MGVDRQVLYQCARATLGFYANSGVRALLCDEPQDRTKKLEVVQKADAPETAQNLLEGVNTLDELREFLNNFKDLGIAKTASNTVFSDGIVGASIMVVTAAPADIEDKTGIPASGRSGALLDKILASIGLSRKENIYIAPAINWRPPGGRTPTDIEIKTCADFLRLHIKLAKPKVIILCGKIAAHTLFGKSSSVSSWRGKWHEYEGAQVRVMHNPDALLKTPLQKKFAWDDMLSVLDKLSEIEYK